MYPNNNNPGYPPQPGFPNNDYSPYPPNNSIGFNPTPYPQAGGGNIGFNVGDSSNIYPSMPGTYPSSGYPPNPSGYPNTGSYPSGNTGGYPGAGSNTGYPGAGSNTGYPGAGSNTGGYPGAGSGGYPGAAGNQGYPNAGYPSIGNASVGGGYSGGSVPPAPTYQQTPNQIIDAALNYGGHGSHGGHGGLASTGMKPIGEPSVRPFQPFNPADDAHRLYKAMKGFGTDETTLIDVLCRRPYNQRLQIAQSYKTQFGKDLYQNICSETRGNLEACLRALMISPEQLCAADIKKACDGAGTDEADIIEIICSRSNNEMIALKNTYKQLYNRNLEQDVASEVFGYFKRLLVSLSTGNRSEAPPNPQKAAEQARELHQAGMKRIGTDEVVFNRIFAMESFAHLRLVFDEYQRLAGHDIEKAIKSEMSGFVEKAFLAIVQLARNPASYYADRLHRAMKGLGTHDSDMIRIIVLRSEVDMLTIKSEYQRKYGKSLESAIKSECSGDYERALLCLIGSPNWK